jgi:hypothetical protein
MAFHTDNLFLKYCFIEIKYKILKKKWKNVWRYSSPPLYLYLSHHIFT